MNNKNKIMIALSLLALFVVTTSILAMYQQQVAQAKSNSIFSAIGDARNAGIDAGAAAFRAGQSNSPSCPSSSTAYCLIYNDAFHKGWNDAKEVAP